ncbi:hypothetical protein G3I30_01565 [Actinospica acidiphila]|uniref:DUF5959 family protein n=1 Tax=unclassified Streptomyces TaxID=2593676 RepID=UPI000C88AB49|nr:MULTISPECIES: DUF5959 family protein [unclassified Streptomyces]MQL61516.1 hypothetical protein [Streptomyces vinaceus]NEA77825.1 hypothetical protein [Actinospica acidiphila]PWE08916.1 hypothetical protein DD630_20270 [Streptomyces sp. BSE7F]MBJ6644396.1 hypothetical protein [Streptomyces sp. BSE7-9]MCA2200008.1 DUF5959 family protein [Streptomyces sp. SMS_SU21]
MPDYPEAELISLSDEEQGVSVRILRAENFSGGEQDDTLRGEITVSSEFVNGHIDLYLNSYDLDSWTAVLNTVESGQTASWLESGRSPRITISPAAISESECTEVSVHDVTASQIHVTVPIAAPSDWIERHRDLLDAVKRRFPLAPDPL